MKRACSITERYIRIGPFFQQQPDNFFMPFPGSGTQGSYTIPGFLVDPDVRLQQQQPDDFEMILYCRDE